MYTGIIVEESLEDNRDVNTFTLLGMRISDEQNPQDRWHLYKVEASQQDIEKISQQMKQGWYAHFWNEQEMLVVFRDIIFPVDPNDRATWAEAISYGMSQGIKAEQLDFVIA